VGDILVTGEDGAQILVAPNLVEHLEGALTQVRARGVVRVGGAGAARELGARV
jgi:RNA-binding protein YlmH